MGAPILPLNFPNSLEAYRENALGSADVIKGAGAVVCCRPVMEGRRTTLWTASNARCRGSSGSSVGPIRPGRHDGGLALGVYRDEGQLGGGHPLWWGLARSSDRPARTRATSSSAAGLFHFGVDVEQCGSLPGIVEADDLGTYVR
ncbi:hypothetical protein [Streptomyces sp. NBC_00454]|uniref:hypothetical protein n=1 Tax=Streptomyces sp. NBC_00454 TaxID=2975747 RepID=UPI0030DE64FA